MELFAKDKINCGRQFEIDCVKVFAIIYMVCIHVYEEMSIINYHTVPNSPFRIIIEFLGGPLAAPVFMFSMGIGMVYTRHNTWRDFISRGVKLLLTGYILNFFRLTVLLLAAQLIGMEVSYPFTITESIFIVDILQFAGMAFIVIGIMKRFALSSLKMLFSAVLLQSIGIWGTKLNIDNTVVSLLTGLFLPTNKQVAFPMMLWLVYPVLGIVFAEYLQKVSDKLKFYKNVFIISITAFIAVSLSCIWLGYDICNFFILTDNSYYHQNLLSMLWTLPLILIVISLSYFTMRTLEKSKAGGFIKFCSSNLNTIYISQWLIIPYTLAVFEVMGLPKLQPCMIIPTGIIITALAIAITFLIKRKNSNRK